MDAISIEDAKTHFSELIDKVSFEKIRIPIEHEGKPLAVIVPLEDLQVLEELEGMLDILEAHGVMKEI